jgi:hypothetical protein
MEKKEKVKQRKKGTGSRWAAGVLLLITLGIGAFFYLLGVLKAQDFGLPEINLGKFFEPKVYQSD